MKRYGDAGRTGVWTRMDGFSSAEAIEFSVGADDPARPSLSTLERLAPLLEGA